MENYSQISKSWAPPYNMYTFFLSNHEFKFLTRSAQECRAMHFLSQTFRLVIVQNQIKLICQLHVLTIRVYSFHLYEEVSVRLLHSFFSHIPVKQCFTRKNVKANVLVK